MVLPVSESWALSLAKKNRGYHDGIRFMFDGNSQACEEYCKTMDIFLVTNDIDDKGKQQTVLLSSVDPQT